MSDVSGIPNLGFGGGSYFGGNAATGQPAMSAAQINAGMWGNYSPQQAQSTLNNIYGPGGFGAQPAYYAGLGAAYGRSTGGFRPGMPASPSGSVQRGPDLPAPSIGNYNPLAGRGHTTNPGRNSVARVMAAGAGDQMGPSGTAGGQTATPHNQMFRMPAANPDYFNASRYAGSQGNYGLPYNGRALPGDVGFSKQPSYPNLGYNPGMANWFANPGMNANPFQNRFGMGFPNAGTPSQVMPNYGETLTPEDRSIPPSFMNPNPGS